MHARKNRYSDRFFQRPLGIELTIAGLLLVVAWVWQAWRPFELLPWLRWDDQWLALGLLASLPPLLIILLLEIPACRNWFGIGALYDDIESVLVPLLGYLRWPEIVLLGILAGLSEEIFFRGVVQQEIGLWFASIAFGLLHAVSLAYVLWATVIGLYLGWLMQTTQSLWPSILAHTMVDWVGLCYLRLIVAPRCAQPVLPQASPSRQRSKERRR